MDPHAVKTLALPGFTVAMYCGDLKDPPQLLPEVILTSAKRAIVYHIPIPTSLSYHGVVDLLRRETASRHIVTVYGTVPGFAEHLSMETATHVTVHATTLLHFSSFFCEIVGNGWSAKSGLRGLLSCDYLIQRNDKLAEVAEIEQQ